MQCLRLYVIINAQPSIILLKVLHNYNHYTKIIIHACRGISEVYCNLKLYGLRLSPVGGRRGTNISTVGGVANQVAIATPTTMMTQTNYLFSISIIMIILLLVVANNNRL